MASRRRVEIVIVGGGPAGLSAALVLGRCRREVVVFDDGTYRNRDARELRGFLTRDGTPPRELRRIAHDELSRYSTVSVVPGTVAEVRPIDGRFALLTTAGQQVDCDAVLLATGFRDLQPAIGGVPELHGDLVVPCPYCDAWEVRDQPLAAFSHPDDRGARFALVLGQWSSDIVFCSEERPQIADGLRRELTARGVRVEHRELRSVERERDGVRLVFTEGGSLWRRKLFYHLGGSPASTLAARAGAKVDDKGSVEVDAKGASSISGLFVAGDATRDVLQAIVAAGEGASAGVTINEYLCGKETYAKPSAQNL